MLGGIGGKRRRGPKHLADILLEGYMGLNIKC